MPSSAKVTQHKFVYLMGLARGALMRNLDRRTQAQVGISATQFGVLFVIAEQDGCLIKTVVEVLAIDPSAMTHMLKRLEKARLVKRTACADDGRATRLFLTEQGREVVAFGARSMRDINVEICADFTSAELDTVARFLQTMIARFSSE